MLSFYRYITFLLHPLLRWWLAWRKRKGKEDPARLSERFGIASAPRPEGTLIWIHAASVGEANSALPLVSPLLALRSGVSVLFTTGTVTSAQLMVEKLPAGAIHQYLPLDTPQAVKRFLAHWKPQLALWVESELWPNLLTDSYAQGCMLLSINSRMSERSFDRWYKFPYAIRRMLCCFSGFFPQSEQDALRLKQLGAQNILAIGNLKYDTPALPCDMNALADLQQQTQGRTLWLAASTHPGEEALIAEVHKNIAVSFPDLLTIIVPRHAVRGNAIAAELETLELSVAQRSRQDKIQEGIAIYLADTMGELGLFYRMSRLAFLGGSLVPHGGQNVLEAVKLGCVPLCGPHTHNFNAVCSALEAAGGMVRVGGVTAMPATLIRILNDAAFLEKASKAGEQYIRAHQGISATIVTAVAESSAIKRG